MRIQASAPFHITRCCRTPSVMFLSRSTAMLDGLVEPMPNGSCMIAPCNILASPQLMKRGMQLSPVVDKDGECVPRFNKHSHRQVFMIGFLLRCNMQHDTRRPPHHGAQDDKRGSAAVEPVHGLHLVGAYSVWCLVRLLSVIVRAVIITRPCGCHNAVVGWRLCMLKPSTCWLPRLSTALFNWLLHAPPGSCG